MTEARMNYDAAISFYQKSMSLLRMAVPQARRARETLDAR